MQPPIDVSLHALNPKTALSLLGMGVLPLLVVFAVIFVMGGGRPPKGVTLTVLLVGGLVTVVGIWQLASVRLRVDAESLTVGGGFYKVSVPLAWPQTECEPSAYRTTPLAREPMVSACPGFVLDGSI